MRTGLLAAILVAGALAGGGASAAARWTTLPALTAMPAPGATGYVSTSGARIYYAAYGRGAPVILLHGGLANSDYWVNQVEPLAKTRRVILIDSRGHGRSSRDGRPYTYELMESDVLGVMDALHIARAAVVGWSDGAIVALVMAMKHPGRVDRVFAFAANMDPTGVKPGAEAVPAFAAFETRAAADYARLSPTPDGFAGFKTAIERMWASEPNYTAADLGRIRVPVAIVDGDHDEAIKAEHTDYLARSIPGARLVILPGISHFAMLQDPQAFNAAVTGFLDAR